MKAVKELVLDFLFFLSLCIDRLGLLMLMPVVWASIACDWLYTKYWGYCWPHCTDFHRQVEDDKFTVTLTCKKCGRVVHW